MTMTNFSTVITFASWEPRFVARIRDDLDGRGAAQVIMFYLDEYAEWTRDNRGIATVLCEEAGVPLVACELQLAAPPGNWVRVRDQVLGHVSTGSSVLVDITTMPREFMWTTFWMLDLAGARTEFVYSRPSRYSQDWLSRDPQRPRLVYKLAGIADPGKRVCLVVLAGYDVDRTRQLLSFYEPAVGLVGLQRGPGDPDNDAKMAENRERIAGEPNICCFGLDAYAADQGQKDILHNVGAFIDTHNVIMASLGPKLSAAALYRIHRGYPQTALAYAPSGQFNRDYSTGVGPAFWGRL